MNDMETYNMDEYLYRFEKSFQNMINHCLTKLEHGYSHCYYDDGNGYKSIHVGLFETYFFFSND